MNPKKFVARTNSRTDRSLRNVLPRRSFRPVPLAYYIVELRIGQIYLLHFLIAAAHVWVVLLGGTVASRFERIECLRTSYREEFDAPAVHLLQVVEDFGALCCPFSAFLTIFSTFCRR